MNRDHPHPSDHAQPGSLAPTVTLVVGVDRHPASHAALAAAIDLATQLRADLHIVHAIDLSDYPIDPDAADWDSQGENALRHEQQQVTAAMAAFPGHWTYQVRRGHPAHVITALADQTGAQLILIGAARRGLTGTLTRALAGSVSGALLKAPTQRRPIIVVPTRDQPSDGPVSTDPVG